MWTHPRLKYVCVPCRLVLRYAERCPSCRSSLRSMYNFEAPRKRDDDGWKKIELAILVQESNIKLCTWTCCVPIYRPGRGNKVKELTLSQYKARIRNMRTHRQEGVPQYYK